jgi:RimJ/RimL family protein N-acetyltransferase
MITTERLLLRPWQDADLVFLQQLRNDIELQALLLSTARGSSLQTIKQWAAAKDRSCDQLFFVIELKKTALPIGYIQLSEESGATQTMRLGICLSPQKQSQGYGSELLLAIDDYVHTNLDIKKLILHVDAANERAIACYRKTGYREVGVMKHHVFIHGRLRNVMIMEKFLGADLEFLS